MRIRGAERLDLVSVAIETDQPQADGVIQKVTDGVAQKAAGNRRHRANESEVVARSGRASDIGTSIASGGTGKNELSAKDTTPSNQEA